MSIDLKSMKVSYDYVEFFATKINFYDIQLNAKKHFDLSLNHLAGGYKLKPQVGPYVEYNEKENIVSTWVGYFEITHINQDEKGGRIDMKALNPQDSSQFIEVSIPEKDGKDNDNLLYSQIMGKNTDQINPAEKGEKLVIIYRGPKKSNKDESKTFHSFEVIRELTKAFKG